MAAAPPFVLRNDDAQMVSPLEAHLVPHGDSFRKAYVEEGEQGAHASEYSGQESEYRWKVHILGLLGTPGCYPLKRSLPA